ARHLGTRVPAGVPAVRLGARARHLAHLLGGPAEPGRPVSAAPALPRGGARTGTRLLLRLLTILVVAAGVVVLGAALAHAAPVPPEDPVAPTEPVEPGLGINLDVGAATPSTSIIALIALTLLGVAPSLILMMTSFTKIFVVLALTRNALGLQGVPPNQVLAGLTLFLSLFIMAPVV